MRHDKESHGPALELNDGKKRRRQDADDVADGRDEIEQKVEHARSRPMARAHRLEATPVITVVTAVTPRYCGTLSAIAS
jgi:hypothetical protein